MCIFANQVLHVEEIDYSKWPTINGDSIVLENARTEYLEKCLILLNQYMNRYSSHVNYPIWEHYTDVVEDILALRE